MSFFEYYSWSSFHKFCVHFGMQKFLSAKNYFPCTVKYTTYFMQKRRDFVEISIWGEIAPNKAPINFDFDCQMKDLLKLPSKYLEKDKKNLLTTKFDFSQSFQLKSCSLTAKSNSY